MKIKGMEASLWAALFALWLINLGSTASGEEIPVGANNTSDTNSTSSEHSLSINSTSLQPQHVFDNETHTKPPNATDVRPTNLSRTESSTALLPPVSPGASNLTTEGAETGTNFPNTTDTSPTPTPPTTSSNHSEAKYNFTTPPTPSNHSGQNETSSPTTAPTPELMTAATVAGLSSNSTSNTSSSQEATTSQPPTQTSQARSGSSPTTSLPNSTSVHSESPSQLNIAGDGASNSPALDPLLAGLVSAFVITAVIITLLLFLKFRRRESGPRFQRLQNLPMDDMMEDTPLSMFTY